MGILVLFTRDLRVHDHLPLFEASREGSEIVPLFVLDPALLGGSPNRDRFLLESLDDLGPQLDEFDLRCSSGNYNDAASVPRSGSPA